MTNYKCPHCKATLKWLYCYEINQESFDFEIATGNMDSIDGSYKCTSSKYECPECNEPITGKDLPDTAQEI